MSRKSLIWSVILFLQFFVWGCGSVDSPLGAGNGLLVSGTSADVALTGKVEPGVALAGAEIQVRLLDGTLLLTTTSDASGNFRLDRFGYPLAPADFRVTASFGSGQELSTEVRGYTGQGRYLVLNVPTTLVSQYLRQHPGESLDSAQARVRTFLSISGERSLEYGIEESVRAPFSHLVFFEQASKNGGWPAYRDQVVGLLSNNPPTPRPYRLAYRVAANDFSGLDPALAGALQSLRNLPRVQLSLTSESAYPLPNFFELLLEPAAETLVPGGQVQGRIVDTILDQVRDVAWTHIADALNLNYGTTTMLENVQGQLEVAIDYLAELKGSLDQLAINTAGDSVNTPVATIQSLTKDLYGNDVASILTPTEQPYTPNSTISQIFSNLIAFDSTSALTAIQNVMLGAGSGSNIMVLTRDQVFGDDTGIQRAGQGGNYPLRNNALLDQVLKPYTYYGGFQQMACNVVGETSHVSSPNPILAETTGVTQVVAPAAVSLKQQRGQIPRYLLSDVVVVDLQGGLMWYCELQANDSISGANKNADNFVKDVGNGITYDDWRLPTKEEARLLQDRARLVAVGKRDSGVAHSGSDASYGNFGYTAQGLTQLGFTNLGYLNNDAGILYNSWIYDVNKGWSLSYSNGENENSEFRLNHENTSVEKTVGKVPYFMVRSIGEPVVPAAAGSTTFVPDHSYPFAYSNVKANEASSLGTIYQLVGTSARTVNKAGTKISYSVATGGDFTLGSGNQASRSYPGRYYAFDLPTYTGSGDTTKFNELAAQVWFTTSNTSILTVGPAGTLFWHTDTADLQTVDLTAHVRSTDGNEYTQTSSIKVTPPVRQLRKVQIFPRNRQYNLTIRPGVSENYYCLAFYSDLSVRDVTSLVTWAVVDDSNGSSTAPNVTFSDQQKGLLIVNKPAPGLVRITASLGAPAAQNDTTRAQIITH